MVHDVTNLISDQCKNVEGNIKSYIDEKFASLNNHLVSTAHSDPNVNVASGFMYTWGGKNHCVPEGFILFPKDSLDNINTLWNTWFFGDKLLKIGPFKTVRGQTILKVKYCYCNNSKVYRE